jgi:diguanylate cyclase (GGDEF)-like protein/PAS domain S-box-containing protein
MASILLLEDKDRNENQLAGCLESRGHAVTAVHDGSHALKAVVSRVFDVVILSTEIDGLDVLKILRQTNSALELPVVIVASDRSDNAVEALKEGANDYLTKPIDYSVALARIEKQLVLKKSYHDLNYQKLLLNCQIEVSPDGILAISNEGNWLSFNRRFLEVWDLAGQVFAEATGQKGFELLLSKFSSPEHFSSVLATLADRPDERSWDELQLGDGRTLEGHSVPFLDPRGIHQGRVWYFRDVTNRKWAEEAQLETEIALGESEERYALAAKAANDGLWDWNLKTDQIYFSPRWKSMLGYEEGDIGNKPEEWFERIHPEDLDRVRRAVADHLEGQSPNYQTEHRMMHRNGNFRWILSRGLAIRDEAGVNARMAGSQTDITGGKVSDPLTGLPNRLLFLERLEWAIKKSKRDKDYLFAVFFLDLDRFKLINDSLGHGIGDQFLVCIAHKLESCLRSTDAVARYEKEDVLARLGGDEFTILLDGIRHIRDATRVAERLQEQLSLPLTVGGHEVFTSASIGIAVSATGYEHAEEILRDADTAMYRAKMLGKSRFELFDPAMREHAVARMALETDLRKALERNEFLLYYQPIVSLDNGALIGFEALARWQHPERGLVPPGEFISVAEETGMILAIGNWVLTEACCQIKAWQSEFPQNPPLMISVNLSGKQFTQLDFIKGVSQTLRESGLDGHCLKLEITESLLMENVEVITAMLMQIKALGVRLGIDDFGTGYSSLSYLHRFPFDTLKVDRSFVSLVGPEGQNSEIVKTIVTLAHNLNFEVIAEGVETAEQVFQLRAFGCELGQGYFFSRPVSAARASALLAQNQPDWQLIWPITSVEAGTQGLVTLEVEAKPGKLR